MPIALRYGALPYRGMRMYHNVPNIPEATLCASRKGVSLPKRGGAQASRDAGHVPTAAARVPTAALAYGVGVQP